MILNSQERHSIQLSRGVVLAHGGVNRVAICQYMGIPLKHVFRLEQDYGCINIVEFSSGYPTVKLLNYQPPLR